MSDATKKVLDMVEQKRISPAEGDALLAAMGRKRRIGIGILFNPYERIGATAGIAAGLAVATAAAAAAVGLDLRFDGFLDLHAGGGTVTVAVAALDQAVGWPLAALVLWLVSLAFGRGGRLVDFLATLGVARAALLLGGLAIAPLAPGPEVLEGMVRDPASALAQLAGLLPMVAVALVTVAWYVTALVFAFRHASGLRRGRLAGAFVAALFAAEVVSKLALWAVG